MANRRRNQPQLQARRSRRMGRARALYLALALVAYLSLLAPSAQADVAMPASSTRTSGTAGRCGGATLGPPANPLTDAASAQWYACWTVWDAFEQTLREFSWQEVVDVDPETGEPIDWETWSPGRMAIETVTRLGDLDSRGQEQAGLLEDLFSELEGVRSATQLAADELSWLGRLN